MKNVTKGRIVRAAALAAVLGFCGAAKAEDAHVQGGVTIGPRASYYDPRDADGNWTGGAQVRFHMGPVFALEGAADWRQDRVGGSVVDTFPVQASLLVYLLQHFPVSPYILGGGGWYHTNVRSPGGTTDNRFGPHAGAGAQFFFNNRWSIDGSYRYIWLSDYRSQTDDSPLGRNIRDRGWQVSAALNYRL